MSPGLDLDANFRVCVHVCHAQSSQGLRIEEGRSEERDPARCRIPQPNNIAEIFLDCLIHVCGEPLGSTPEPVGRFVARCCSRCEKYSCKLAALRRSRCFYAWRASKA